MSDSRRNPSRSSRPQPSANPSGNVHSPAHGRGDHSTSSWRTVHAHATLSGPSRAYEELPGPTGPTGPGFSTWRLDPRIRVSAPEQGLPVRHDSPGPSGQTPYQGAAQNFFSTYTYDDGYQPPYPAAGRSELTTGSSGQQDSQALSPHQGYDGYSAGLLGRRQTQSPHCSALQPGYTGDQPIFDVANRWSLPTQGQHSASSQYTSTVPDNPFTAGRGQQASQEEYTYDIADRLPGGEYGYLRPSTVPPIAVGDMQAGSIDDYYGSDGAANGPPGLNLQPGEWACGGPHFSGLWKKNRTLLCLANKPNGEPCHRPRIEGVGPVAEAERVERVERPEGVQRRR